VVAFLSQDWLDLQRIAATDFALDLDLPSDGDPTASAVILTTVTGGPDGNVTYTTTIEHGRIVAAAIGEPSGQPDLTFSVGYDDAVRQARGEVELSTLFMQGRLKADGDTRKLFALLAVDHGAEARALLAEIADQTDF
jgi:SCP-2 sterol transfer family protein